VVKRRVHADKTGDGRKRPSACGFLLIEDTLMLVGKLLIPSRLETEGETPPWRTLGLDSVLLRAIRSREEEEDEGLDEDDEEDDEEDEEFEEDDLDDDEDFDDDDFDDDEDFDDDDFDDDLDDDLD